MCGISGYVLAPHHDPLPAEIILAMNRAIAHRGPDDEGISLIEPSTGGIRRFTTSDTAAGIAGSALLTGDARERHHVALGHRRFSIIDLSIAGHQPFWSADGQFGIVFNGEIYNYLEVRAELESRGHSFRTQSDTEVLLEAFRAWGDQCFGRLNGFFAVAIWDGRRRQVLLARDRIGKAPLYLARTSEGLFWSSEIKGLLAVNRSSFHVRDQAVVDYVNHGWRDLQDRTFYDEIVTFPRASYAWVEPSGTYTPRSYWSIPSERLTPKDITVEEAARGLRERLTDAVRLRMRADVPMGFELSGGLDSSSLVALAASAGHRLTAYTVAFDEPEANEEPFARAVAERYGTQVEYQILRPPREDFFDHADRYMRLLDEPFHSPNLQTNQGVWRTMSSRGIRVSINGAAGDELLAGYSTDYFQPFLRSLVQAGHPLTAIRQLVMGRDLVGNRARDWARLGLLAMPERAFRRRPRRERPTTRAFLTPSSVMSARPGPSRELAARLLDDMGEWRMNYWLRSGNTSFMGVPVEVRAPFLDYKVVEHAFRLPLEYLVHDGWFKWILRVAMRDLLPPSVGWRRRKAGFPFPLRSWLEQHERRILDLTTADECPFIDAKALRTEYRQLVTSDPSYAWRLVCLGLWYRRCVLNISLTSE